MCGLLGLSSNTPADLSFSFSGLKQRGGNTGIHIDGWGISLYEGRGSRSIHDAKASTQSKVADFEADYFTSKLIILLS